MPDRNVIYVPVDPKTYGCGLFLGFIYYYWRQIIVGIFILALCTGACWLIYTTTNYIGRNMSFGIVGTCPPANGCVFEIKDVEDMAWVHEPALSKDARLLAVNTSPAGVQIWDMQKQPPTQLWVIPGDGDLVFSNDGKLLAIVSGGATILDVSSGQILQKFAGGSFENSLFAVQFSPDGRTLAGLGISNTLSWWDVQSGQLLSQVVIDQCEKTFALQASSDGTLVVGCGADKLLLWDMTTHTFQREINLEPYLPRGNKTYQSIVVEKLIFSPDNHYLAVSGRYDYSGGYSNPYIQIWDFQNQIYLSSIMAYIQYADGFQSVNDKMTFVTIENPFDGTTITSNIVKLVYHDLQTGNILQEAALPARMGTVKKIGGLASLSQFGEVILAGTKEGFSMWKLDSP